MEVNLHIKIFLHQPTGHIPQYVYEGYRTNNEEKKKNSAHMKFNV